MKNEKRDIDKELYRRLRALSLDELWKVEVARFDGAAPAERVARVAVVRAVGVVFSESGSPERMAEARAWLVGLLKDPDEKVRRYAMTALPKLGSGSVEEAALLVLLKATTNEREKKFLAQTLEKIGGTATLDVAGGSAALRPQTELKIKAAVARRSSPGRIRMDGVLTRIDRLRIHLRCRRGLEPIARDEAEEYIGTTGKFRLLDHGSRWLALAPTAPFSLADIYKLRCFGAVGFVLGSIRGLNPAETVESLAALIASPLSRNVLSTFTEGPVRYRLEFVSKGHQRGAIRQVANRAYALCPDILNDARLALWSVDVHPFPSGLSVELRPRLYPDPRWYYRVDDVPAASHPPLAACMARLATATFPSDDPLNPPGGLISKRTAAKGNRAPDREIRNPQSAIRNASDPPSEIVWDPFCGSGQELVERALRGGVARVCGTDISPEAIAIARANVAAAKLDTVAASFACRDFRDPAGVEGLEPGRVNLIVTNPPMGRRIRIPNLRGLIGDLFEIASRMLAPGGRLVFANPVRVEPRDPSMRLQYRQSIDLGGFDCQLEMYRKNPDSNAGSKMVL